MMRKQKDIFWGIILILVALAALGLSTGYIQGTLGTLIWVGILVGISITSLITLSWGGVFFPLAIVAHIYRTPLNITDIWPLYIAALLLTIGFSLITSNLKRNRRKRRRQSHSYTRNYKGFNDDTIIDIDIDVDETIANAKAKFEGFRGSSSMHHDEEVITIENNFNDASRYINSQNLKYLSVENNLGNLRVYFDTTVFSSEGSLIRVENNLGKTTLYFPSNVNLVNNLTASLGSVTTEGRNSSDPQAPTVRLDGEANLGHIEVVFI